MSVDTKRVEGRRRLRYTSYDDLLADARQLASAPRKQLGNWSLAQICRHLSGALAIPIDGTQVKPFFLLRWIGPLLKKRFCTQTMKPGFQVPRAATKLLPCEGEDAAAIAELEAAVRRLQKTTNRLPHPIFGPMTNEEWDQFQLRHAELHMSFIVPA